jgi:hypothetical protein
VTALVRAAPKKPKRPRGGLAAWLQRAEAIAAANRLLQQFYFDRNPAWIVRACGSLRADGVGVPPAWRKAEAWAKGRARGRGQPANAEQLRRVVELYRTFDALWPKRGGARHAELQKLWIARELGILNPERLRGKPREVAKVPSFEYWASRLTETERRRALNHVRVLLHRARKRLIL